MTGQCYDFAVVGGGLVGATIARGLARQGLKVVVLDEGDVAYRASRGNFALVWVQSKGLNMPAYANWTRRSVLLWPSYAEALEAETGIDVSLEQEGGFHLALSEAEMERTVSLARRINAQPGVTPYTYSVLDGDEIRRRLPGAGPEIVGGTYSPMDGHLNALRLFRATHKAMLVAGVDYRPRQAVVSIGSNDGFRLFSSDAAEVRAVSTPNPGAVEESMSARKSRSARNNGRDRSGCARRCHVTGLGHCRGVVRRWHERRSTR